MMSAKEIKKHAKELGLTLVGDGRKKGVKTEWLFKINEALQLREATRKEDQRLGVPLSKGHQFWDGKQEYFVYAGNVHTAHAYNTIECGTATRAGRYEASTFNWNWYAKANHKLPVLTSNFEFYYEADLSTMRQLLTRTILRYFHTKLSDTPNLKIARDTVEQLIAPNGEVNGDTLEQINLACEKLIKYKLAYFSEGFWYLTELGIKQARIFLA